MFQSEVALGRCSCTSAHPWWRRGEVAAQVLLGEQVGSPPHIAAWNRPRASRPWPCSPSPSLPSTPPGSASSPKQPSPAGRKTVAPQPLNCRAGRPQGSSLARCPRLRDTRPGPGQFPGRQGVDGLGAFPQARSGDRRAARSALGMLACGSEPEGSVVCWVTVTLPTQLWPLQLWTALLPASHGGQDQTAHPYMDYGVTGFNTQLVSTYYMQQSPGQAWGAQRQTSGCRPVPLPRPPFPSSV